MPKVAFGTGTTFTNRTDDVFDGISKAFNAGYRLFDTAMVYGTETGVGKAVCKLLDEGLCKREDVFITTKIPPIYSKFDDVCTMLILQYKDPLYYRRIYIYKADLYQRIHRLDLDKP